LVHLDHPRPVLYLRSVAEDGDTQVRSSSTDHTVLPSTYILT
jgi:hypothetical protein